MTADEVRIQQAPFDPAQAYLKLESEIPATGAICTFTGLARVQGDQKDVTGLFLEHFPGMTERAIEEILLEAHERWPLQRLLVIHRIGALRPGERIVFVGAASTHRAAAFDACEFIMDYLKTRAPFWKKEITTAGEYWVEQKASDRERARRWEPKEDAE